MPTLQELPQAANRWVAVIAIRDLGQLLRHSHA